MDGWMDGIDIRCGMAGMLWMGEGWIMQISDSRKKHSSKSFFFDCFINNEMMKWNGSCNRMNEVNVKN